MKFIKRFNESANKNTEDYFIELDESELGVAEIVHNVINVYFTHDVNAKDASDELDIDSRIEICLRQIDYFKLIKRILDDIKADYNVKIQSHEDRDPTHFTWTLIDKNLKEYYEIKDDNLFIYQHKIKELMPNIDLRKLTITTTYNNSIGTKSEIRVTLPYTTPKTDRKSVKLDVERLSSISKENGVSIKEMPDGYTKMVDPRTGILKEIPFYNIIITSTKYDRVIKLK